jgi:hypothetical protein
MLFSLILQEEKEEKERKVFGGGGGEIKHLFSVAFSSYCIS